MELDYRSASMNEMDGPVKVGIEITRGLFGWIGLVWDGGVPFWPFLLLIILAKLEHLPRRLSSDVL